MSIQSDMNDTQSQTSPTSNSHPLEAMVRGALDRAGIVYLNENQNSAHLDFYLPVHKVHIEIKSAHTPRSNQQLARAANVILVQGDEAARFFAALVAFSVKP